MKKTDTWDRKEDDTRKTFLLAKELPKNQAAVSRCTQLLRGKNLVTSSGQSCFCSTSLNESYLHRKECDFRNKASTQKTKQIGKSERMKKHLWPHPAVDLLRYLYCCCGCFSSCFNAMSSYIFFSFLTDALKCGCFLVLHSLLGKLLHTCGPLFRNFQRTKIDLSLRKELAVILSGCHWEGADSTGSKQCWESGVCAYYKTWRCLGEVSFTEGSPSFKSRGSWNTSGSTWDWEHGAWCQWRGIWSRWPCSFYQESRWGLAGNTKPLSGSPNLNPVEQAALVSEGNLGTSDIEMAD